MGNEFDDFKNILASQKNKILTEKQKLEIEKEQLEQKKKEEERETERQYSINYRIFEESGILGVLNGIIENNLLAGKLQIDFTYRTVRSETIERRKEIRKGKPHLSWGKSGSWLSLIFNAGIDDNVRRPYEPIRQEWYDYIDFRIINGHVRLVYKFGYHQEKKFIDDLNEIKKAIADVILRDSSEEKSIYKSHYDER